MKTTPEQEAEYRTFIQDTGYRCWRCGRTIRNKPKWYFAEWRIDPHHIVRHPRKRDRRAVVSFCAVCHSIQHEGSVFLHDRRRPLDLSELMQIKAQFDPGFYDEVFLQSCNIQRLPDPSQVTFTNYFDDQITQSSGEPGDGCGQDGRDGDGPRRLEETPPETDAGGSRTS